MTDQFIVTRFPKGNFIELTDSIIAEARFNPIYSSSFDAYYEEVSKKKSKNISAIVSKGNTPILCLLRSVPTEDSLTPKLEYFGRPAALISNPNVDAETLSKAADTLGSLIHNDYANLLATKVDQGNGSLRISGSRIISTRYFQNLISTFNKSETRFTRVLNLTQNLDAITADYSKSVRSAIRVNKSELEHIEIIDENSNRKSIAIAFDALRDLHHKSAGRMTRTEESWGIQQTALDNGQAFISQISREGVIVSSAYFMRTRLDCYYGVSASIPKQNRDSLSHLCVHYAIKYCTENNLHSFHLGDQLTHLSCDISDKEKNIERFKSFFGGEIVLEILFSK
jgi:hypothetical protein